MFLEMSELDVRCGGIQLECKRLIMYSNDLNTCRHDINSTDDDDDRKCMIIMYSF